MFIAIRIMILIASAYAGSVVAEMQFAPLSNSAFVVSAVRYAILAHVLAQPASGTIIITTSVIGCSC